MIDTKQIGRHFIIHSVQMEHGHDITPSLPVAAK